MGIDDRKKTTYTKNMLVKTISKECKRDKETVKDVYDAIENSVFSILSSADENSDVSIRLFEGIVFDGVYVPEHEKFNNLTGEMIVAKSKVVPKARITRTYCDKVNAN